MKKTHMEDILPIQKTYNKEFEKVKQLYCI